MIETYYFIIWMHTGGLSASDYSNIVCNTADLLERFFGESVINFRTAWSKKEACPIKMSREFMLHEIEVARQKRKDSIPLRFGYFSSLDDDHSFGFQCSFDDLLDPYSLQIPDSIIIHFPIRCSKIFNDFDGFYQLFKAIVKETDPYYAFMPNHLNHRLSDVYWTTKPTFVHTFNYYANDTVRLIGKKKLLREPNIEKTDNGLFLKLLDEPLSIHDPGHLQIQEDVSKRLGLTGQETWFNRSFLGKYIKARKGCRI